LFILSGAYLLLNAVLYDGKILHADVYRPCAGHLLGSMSIGGRRYENNDIFPKMFACRPTTAGWLAGCSSARPVHYY